VTGTRTLLPLRIPELGPYLGKLVTGTGREPGVPLDAVRQALVTRLFDHAGEARRLAANGERAAAMAALARANWLAAWEEAAAAAAALVWTRITELLAQEADRVRMPPAVRDRFLPGAAERRALGARLGSAGAVFVPAIDEIDRSCPAAFQASALERHAMERWLDALRTAARRLEAAWMELEDRVAAELTRSEPQANRVAAWRRSLWPVWLGGTVAVGLALWLGLALGGYIPAPSWLAPLVAALPG
jgi:hypothetical protein